jgi:antitoxin ParD1/3/4
VGITERSKAVNVSLTPHFEAFIDQLVQSGRYGNASEVVRDAMRLLEARESKLAALRAAIEEGIASGPSEPLEKVETVLQLVRSEREAKLDALRAAIEEGIASGPSEPWEGAEEIKRLARAHVEAEA